MQPPDFAYKKIGEQLDVPGSVKQFGQARPAQGGRLGSRGPLDKQEPQASQESEPETRNEVSFNEDQIKAIHELVGSAISKTTEHLLKTFLGRTELDPLVEEQIGRPLQSLRDGFIGDGKCVARGPFGSYITIDFPPMSWAGVNLGYVKDSNAITIPAGNLWFETKSRIQVAEKEVTISEDQTWIWVEHEYGSDAATIESGTDEPVDTITTMKWPLSLWAFADSVATIEELCWVGDIKITAVRGQ